MKENERLNSRATSTFQKRNTKKKLERIFFFNLGQENMSFWTIRRPALGFSMM